MGVRQRRLQTNYLKVNDEFVLMGTGFSELNESPSAQTSSKRYINQKSATKAITGYDWSTAYTTDQIRDERAIEFICNIGEMQLTGSDTETDYVIVDLDKPGSQDNTFRARKFKVAIEVAEFGDEDGEMTASGNLLGISDPILGTFNTTTKTFTVGFNEALGTLTVSSSAGTTTGKTKLTVTPTLTVGNSYKYKTATTVNLPTVNEYCNSGYSVWDGVSDITATTADKILIVEIDPSNKAKKAGITTVTSKG